MALFCVSKAAAMHRALPTVTVLLTTAAGIVQHAKQA